MEEKKGFFHTLDKGTEKLENFIMSAGLIFISFIVFTNVVSRYFFGYSFAWSEELARYIVVWVTFFGISSCARYGSHVNVDLLPGMLKSSAKKIHAIIVNGLMIVVSVYMTVISAGYTLQQFRGGNTSIAVAIPIWLIYLSTVIGFALMSYVYIRKLMGLLHEKRKNEEGEAC